MEILKNDIVGFVNSLKYDKPGHSGPQNNSHTKDAKQYKKKVSSDVEFDQIRSKTMKLNDQIKELQNSITYYQMQSEFLKNFQESSEWQNSLKNFTKKLYGNFPQNQKTAQKISRETKLTEYQEQLQKEIHWHRQQLNRNRVQLQNIFAAGLLKEPNINQEMISVKNRKEIKDAFKTLRVDTISYLLN